MNDNSDSKKVLATDGVRPTEPTEEVGPSKRMSPADIFHLIHKEESLCQTLPKRKGLLTVQIWRSNSKAQSAELKQVYCYLRNKQLKIFKDSKMLQMEGIIDFDLVQCAVMLDNEKLGHHEPKIASFADKVLAAEDLSSARAGTSSNDPTKFKIEVKGSDSSRAQRKNMMVFTFSAASHKANITWYNALLTNW